MRAFVFVVGAAFFLAPTPVRAQEAPPVEEAPAAREAVLLPARVIDAESKRPAAPNDRNAALLRHRLDAVLADAVQDLGLTIDLTHRGEGNGGPVEEADVGPLAARVSAVVVATTLVDAGRSLELRIVLAGPQTKNLLLRVERVSPADIEVRAAVMLRDLLADLDGRGGSSTGLPPSSTDPVSRGLSSPARSAGRPALAVGATLFGGFYGYSVLRSSGSDDPRLLYPLLAVGAGIGLGGSLIISDEWDVGAGDAAFLLSGVSWPSLSAHLIYEGRFADHALNTDERWTFGLVGGTLGLTLSTLALAKGGMSEGGATLSHSGAGVGLVFGGLTELFVEGKVENTPLTGMGYGAAAGWLALSAAATEVRVPSGRIFAADLGAALGGLGGAAVASPLLFDQPTSTDQRIWVGATAAGAVAGGALAWFFTRDTSVATAPSRWATWVPQPGVLGASQGPRGPAPIVGLGVSGPL